MQTIMQQTDQPVPATRVGRIRRSRNAPNDFRIFIRRNALRLPRRGSRTLRVLTPYLLLAAVVFAALPQIAHADDGCDEFRGPPAHQHGGMPPPRGMMGGGKPPMNMQRPAGPFAELGLSDVQQKKVDELMRAQSPRLCEAERAAHLSMQELQQLSQSEKFDEKKAGTIAEAHGKAVADLTYLHAEMHARIWGLLSDSQRKRLADQQRQWARP